MNFSMLADIQSAFETFFVSLTSSVSYNLLFILGIALEVFLIVLFAVMNRFSYEARMRRSLDTLNRWLFNHKILDKENIKEFSNLIKRAPKRLNVNWQQYILYREKAPSEYMSVENLIEKPLRTSSYSANIRNLTWISIVWSLITFIVGISFQNVGVAVVSGTMIIIALVVPMLIAIMCVASVIVMNARKNANLDELYQNLHLFDRFIDNACLDLPPYIDYSLLFTAQEIDKGIPALREYLESRARKEKEEFDKIAKQDSVNFEKYDFEGIGIDGQNILERAMKESEAYLSRKDKTIAKIAQIEANIESIKKNFDNVQKDFQKRMQVSKENIERLRQQQEETTSRIESNFLRKQQLQEIAKQEKEEEDFEKQKLTFLSQKSEFEDEIKSLSEEIESGRLGVEEAMLSEYETFYSKLFTAAISEAEKKVKNKLTTLSQTKQEIEESLTVKEAQLKRVIDENETLKRKLGLDYEQIAVESAAHTFVEEKKDEEPEEKPALVTPEEVAKAVQEKAEEVKASEVATAAEDAPQRAVVEEYVPSVQPEQVKFEEYTPSAQEYKPTVSEYVPSEPAPVQEEEEEFNEDDFDFVDFAPKPQPQDEAPKAAPAPAADGAKRRGRPRKGEEKKLEEIVGEKKSRGRPAGSTKAATAAKKTAAAGEKRGRGRPAGSTKAATAAKKPAATATEKRGRGRPKKETAGKDLNDINKKIDDEQKRLSSIKTRLDGEIQQAINGLEVASAVQARREEILEEINALRSQVEKVKAENSASEIENINRRIEILLQEIKALND